MIYLHDQVQSISCYSNSLLLYTSTPPRYLLANPHMNQWALNVEKCTKTIMAAKFASYICHFLHWPLFSHRWKKFWDGHKQIQVEHRRTTPDSKGSLKCRQSEEAFMISKLYYTVISVLNFTHPPHKITGLPGHVPCRETHHGYKERSLRGC